MTLWGHLCCVGYGIQAHADAARHMARGHRVTWFSGCVNPWTGHLGCVLCEECPDTSIEDGKHAGVAMWSRDSRVVMWLAQRLCGWLGHREFKHPQQPRYGFWAYLHDEWYCGRCLADVAGPEKP